MNELIGTEEQRIGREEEIDLERRRRWNESKIWDERKEGKGREYRRV